MTFSDEERAELIAALSFTADMVGILLKQLDLIAGRARQWPNAHGCESRAYPVALGDVASATGQVALAAHGLDDRAADEGAVGNKEIAEDCNAR